MKKLVKIGAIAFGVLIVLFFAVAAFLPNEMSVTRTEVIDAPADSVFDRVNNLRTFVQWIPWGVELDSSIELEFSDPEVGEGAWYRWTGDDSGHGTTTLVESVRPERIRMAIEFDEGKMAATNRFRFEPESGGRATRVSWELRTDDGGHLLHRYFLPIMEKMVGPFLVQGLSDLKKLVESAPAPVPEAPVPEAPVPETPEEP